MMSKLQMKRKLKRQDLLAHLITDPLFYNNEKSKPEIYRVLFKGQFKDKEKLISL